MGFVMSRRYNLRSGRQECHIPVQLQLAGDEECFGGILEVTFRNLASV